MLIKKEYFEFKLLMKKIRFFVDRTSLEIFHQNGAEVSTQLMYPISDNFKWKLQSDNQDMVLYNMTIFKL
jgi:sucrose-6-phosphate hydrolase SacC (GH32 family)